MASSLIPGSDTDKFPIESPLGLFAPAHHVETQIPAPLYLLEYVPGKLESRYDTDEDGFLTQKPDWYEERVIRYEDGSRCRVEVTGHPKLGLPTLYDWDYLLGLFRIVDEGGVDRQGRFLDPAYRAIVRAAGRSESGAEAWNAVKRALARWGALTIKTWTDITFEEDAQRVRLGGGYPAIPGGYPPRREIETSHHVLTYDVERYLRGEVEYHTIDELRIDPVWLDQNVAGISAWIDVEVHNGLRSPTAKAIYQRMALRAARGYRQDLVVELDQLLVQLSKKPAARPARDLGEIRRALDSLAESAVIADYSDQRVGRGRYEITIAPGRRLQSANLLRGVGAEDPMQTRRLLYHLGRFNIATPVARELIRKSPAQVLSVLWRTYYLTEGPGAKGKGIGNLAGWIVTAVREEWRFDEPEYQAWIEEMTQTARQNRTPAPSATVSPVEDAVPAAEPEPVPVEADPPAPLPDHVWGQALQRFQGQVSPTMFDTWLRPTWLDRVTEDEVRVRTENAFAPDWIGRWKEDLEAVLTDLLERPVRLVVRCVEVSAQG